MNGMYLYDRWCAGEEKNMETKNLSESTICCFGDSTTWGDNGCGGGGNDISWTSHLGALLGGATIENFGIKGSRIAVKADRSDSFVERLDGIDHTSRLVFITPCKTSGKHEKDIPASNEANHLGLTQDAYVQAMLEVCDRYSVPVIDLYAQSGISPFLPEHRELYMPDGLHYSPAGYERLAYRIAAGLTAVCR